MEIIESEIRQIFASIVWNHKIHEKDSDINSFWYNLLEFIKILSSTATTSGLLSCLFVDNFKLKIATTICSAICLFITNFYKIYNFKELKDSHKASAMEFFELRNETISILSDIKLAHITLDEAILKRNEILNKYHDICKKSLNTSDNAVQKASKSLKTQQDNTFSDNEIDSYLPIELRKEH
jgi:hypothetical protein